MKTAWTIYIGTFSDSFFSMTFDPETLEAENLHSIYNPGGRSAYFALSSDARYLYTANEYQKGPGGLGAFRLNGNDDPVFLNALKSNSQGPAHISMMHVFGRDYLLGSGYFDGDVMVCPIPEDGHLPPMSDNFRLSEEARAHGIRPVPGTAFAITTDTFHGLIYTYEMTPEGKLIKRQCYSDPELKAPRHMTFSKDGKRLFMLTERTSTLEVYDIDRETGALTHTAHFSNLPDDFEGTSSSSAIHSSPDGQYVYLSNRGHNSITVYYVGEGAVKKVGCVSDSINWPREFMIDPNGEFMLVGNQNDPSISIFRMNKANGMPEFTGKKIPLTEGPTAFICLPKSPA